MKVYIFQAALLCADCGVRTREALAKSAPTNPDDESSYDSDVFPKGPYANGGGEADTPQHCDHCGTFLENPLTDDGCAYVEEAVKRFGPSEVEESWEETAKRIEALGGTLQGNGPTVAEWVRFYLADGQ